MYLSRKGTATGKFNTLEGKLRKRLPQQRSKSRLHIDK